LANDFGSTISIVCGSKRSYVSRSSIVILRNPPADAVIRRRPNGDTLVLRSTTKTWLGRVGSRSVFFLPTRLTTSFSCATFASSSDVAMDARHTTALSVVLRTNSWQRILLYGTLTLLMKLIGILLASCTYVHLDGDAVADEQVFLMGVGLLGVLTLDGSVLYVV